MGQAVIGGVIASSLLTLVVVPVIYGFLDDFGGWMRKGRQTRRGSTAHPPQPGETTSANPHGIREEGRGNPPSSS
jgi:HAE1 family hydrophobic/amphiphilic exporter-1